MNDLWSKYFVLYELIEISLYYSGDIHWIVPNIQFFPWNITRYCAFIHRVKNNWLEKPCYQALNTVWDLNTYLFYITPCTIRQQRGGSFSMGSTGLESWLILVCSDSSSSQNSTVASGINLEDGAAGLNLKDSSTGFSIDRLTDVPWIGRFTEGLISG